MEFEIKILNSNNEGDQLQMEESYLVILTQCYHFIEVVISEDDLISPCKVREIIQIVSIDVVFS